MAVDLVVAVAATGVREADGGWWGGLSVPKPPEGGPDILDTPAVWNQPAGVGR